MAALFIELLSSPQGHGKPPGLGKRDIPATALRSGDRVVGGGRRRRNAPDLERGNRMDALAAWPLPLSACSFAPAHQRRRARWLARISECLVEWDQPCGRRRSLSFHRGQIGGRRYIFPGEKCSLTNDVRRPQGELMRYFDLATYDRLRILLTEIRVLLTAGNNVELILSPDFRISAGLMRRVWLREEHIQAPTLISLPWENLRQS